MRITQLVSNFHATRPTFQKAINAHVAQLTDSLVDRGHEVHLFASQDSETKAKLHAFTESLSKSGLPEETIKHYINLLISECYKFSATNTDIIHSHFSLLSSFFAHISPVPTLTSIHSPIMENILPLMEHFKDQKYVSFSFAQRKQAPNINWYANIYHGVDMNHFIFNDKPKDYLLYLGRITSDKGVHIAIEAAKATNIPLVIAGTTYRNEGYWHDKIEPHIDGLGINFIGEADYMGKMDLLRNAKALLFPTQTQEVFGYVMIESMACGTPVIGINNGSVAEVIQHNETGFVVDDVNGMIDGIREINEIDREKVRERAERYFSLEKMVSGYEKVYKKVLDEKK